MIETFGDKFRITFDEQRDPLIRCKNGFIYEGGPLWLGAWIETTKPTAKFKAARVRFPGVTMPQCGEGECVLKYTLSGDFKEDCKFLRYLGCHKKKTLSPEERARLVESGKVLAARTKADQAAGGPTAPRIDANAQARGKTRQRKFGGNRPL